MSKTQQVTGKVVLPLVDLSFSSSDSKRKLVIETAEGKTHNFRIDASKIEEIRQQSSSFKSDAPAAEATIEFKQTVLGKVEDAKITAFKPGWIREPK